MLGNFPRKNVIKTQHTENNGIHLLLNLCLVFHSIYAELYPDCLPGHCLARNDNGNCLAIVEFQGYFCRLMDGKVREKQTHKEIIKMADKLGLMTFREWK